MLYFDPVAHTYKNPLTQEEYISTTTLLSRYKKPFDVEKMSKRIAEKEGISQEEVKAKWKKINGDSKIYGQNFHNALEQYHKEHTVQEGYEDIIEAYEDLGVIDKDDELLVEEKLFNHYYKLAGTSDIIRLEKNGGFSIFDLKTNKKFNLYSQYNECLLNPIQHLSACEFNTYGLQLSIYAYMFHGLTGRRVNQLGVIYFDKETKKFSYYPVTYLLSDVKAILDHYAKNRLG